MEHLVIRALIGCTFPFAQELLQRVSVAINKVLSGTALEPIAGVEFTNASDFGSLPDSLDFGVPVYQSEGAEHKQVGTLSGKFHHADNKLQFDLDLFNGIDQTGIKCDVPPLP